MQRLNRRCDLDLIRHYPAFEVTSSGHVHTVTQKLSPRFLIKQDESEAASAGALMSPTPTPAPAKTLWFLINYGTHL